MADQSRQKALEERAGLLEGAIEATHDGLLILDLQRQVVHYNQRYLTMFGLSAEQLNASGARAIVNALAAQLEDGRRMVVSCDELWADPTLETLDTIRFKDGRVYEQFTAPHRLGSRIVVGRVASYRDITASLRGAQWQRLEATGRLAGGIAHDLNNALTSIMGYSELVLNVLKDDHQAKADVQEIRRAAGRAESVTRQLLAFSQKQMLEPRLFSLGDAIANLSRVIQRLVGSAVTITIEAPPDLPAVYADPGQIEQVVLNMAVNAGEAMPDGGRLTISMATVDLDEAFTRTHQPMRPGRYIELIITDTGKGMSTDTQSRVFEPFFTTKGIGKGTGLGLSMVYGTVKQSGGFIFVESELGRGTTLRLFFPPAEGRILAGQRTARPKKAPSNAIVLVAEDEGPVRNLVVMTLRQKGYQVLHAASGHDALAIASAENRPIDLLLTDASMPGMSGLELARTLVQARPDMHVVVMSGYTEETLNLSGLGKPAMLLQKPFTPRELQQKIEEAFGGWTS